jgi:signal transduction histidine kinase
VRSLFARILVWFVVTIGVTTVGLLLTAAVTFTGAQPRQTPFALLVTLQLAEAREAYERGGQPELAGKLEQYRKVLNIGAMMTDENGRDLVSGEDRSDLIRAALDRPRFPLLRQQNFILARQDDTGKYWFLLELPRGRFLGWMTHPQFLPILGLAVLLCYLLAYSLTRPVRSLQTAVDRFGQGDLTARVQSERSDELGELARTFDRMADRIQTLLTAERRLLLDISHELRSPLARLAIAVELARSGEDRNKALDRIQRESDRLNELVSELLQVTRAEGDPHSLAFETVRLDELLGVVVEDARLEAGARNVEVSLERSDPVSFRGNPELLRRAVENVVRNAIRYAPPNSTITVSLEVGPPVVVRVRDQGPGVPEGELQRIFDPFYRVAPDRDRQSGGVGLGLAIARRAVELHQGTIAARNALPGLEVSITLPGQGQAN